MKSRAESLRAENLKAVRKEVENFRKFRKLDEWTDVALELSQHKTLLGLHSDRE